MPKLNLTYGDDILQLLMGLRPRIFERKMLLLGLSFESRIAPIVQSSLLHS